MAAKIDFSGAHLALTHSVSNFTKRRHFEPHITVICLYPISVDMLFFFFFCILFFSLLSLHHFPFRRIFVYFFLFFFSVNRGSTNC